MSKRSWEVGFLLALLASSVIAQSCMSLEGSKQCPAFQNASISMDSQLTGYLWVDFGYEWRNADY